MNLVLTRALFLLIPLGLLFILAHAVWMDAAAQWPLWAGVAGASIALFGRPRPTGR
ncbi:MAG: hypothetical protein M5U01_13610 [Ardenticatenaceae bacterium]|nr:hypothetical protein [Ardenticatenaceae bacterium]